MIHQPSNNQENILFLLRWTGVSILGWLLVPINALNPTMRSYLEVVTHAVAYMAFGLFQGIVIGIGQWVLLKGEIKSTKRWLFLTLAGYTLAWPVGLMIETLIPTVVFPLQNASFLPLVEPSATISFFPFPFDIFMGGWVIGLAQWISLRRILPFRTSQMAALWIFGVWLSIGLGIFTPLPGDILQYGLNWNDWFNPILALERSKIGLVSGGISGLLYLAVLNANNRRSSLVSKT